MKVLIKLQKPGNFQNTRSHQLGPILGRFSGITLPNEVQFVQKFYHT